ncbi:MAG: phospholipid-binding protein MlaC [Desulfovibrio sp.]
MKRIFTILVLLGAIATSADAAWAQTPTETLKAGLDSVLAILQDPRYDTSQGISEDHLDAMRNAVHQFFDFRELTKRAVGRPWTGFTDQQRNELTNVFTKLLEKTYLRKLNTEYLKELAEFKKESIVFLDEQIKGDKAMVYTRLQLTDKPLDVNFRLIERDGRWWTYDVIGEGLTLLGIYQDEFKNILVNKTPEDLISILKEKIQAIDEKHDKTPATEAPAS